MPHSRRAGLLVSFSGLDGSGKSTQIERLLGTLRASGRSPATLAFWDDVVVLSRYREGFVHRVFGSERGIGAPGRPVRRRDKNVRRWYLTPLRAALYLLDAVHLRMVVGRARRSGVEFIVIDRYIYDELANLPLGSPLARAFVRVVQAIVPRPDLAYLLDANPEEAVTRKPEYPLEFMRQCRESYLRLAHMVGMVIVPAMPLDRVTGAVHRTLQGAVQQPLKPSAAEPAPAA